MKADTDTRFDNLTAEPRDLRTTSHADIKELHHENEAAHDARDRHGDRVRRAGFAGPGFRSIAAPCARRRCSVSTPAGSAPNPAVRTKAARPRSGGASRSRRKSAPAGRSPRRSTRSAASAAATAEARRRRAGARAVLRADAYSPTGRPGSRAVMFRFGTWPTGITSTSSRSATSTTETVFEWALAT